MISELKTYLKHLTIKIGNFLYISHMWLFKTGAVLITYLIGSYYTIKILYNFNENTTNITNVAFGIVASLSALSFSGSRAVEEQEDKTLFGYAGERFLHAAIFLILASVVKYASLSFFPYLDKLLADNLKWLITTSKFITAFLMVGLFSFALQSTGIGMRTLSNVLMDRYRKYTEWS